MYTKSIIFFLAFYFSVLFIQAQNNELVLAHHTVYETVIERVLVKAETVSLECAPAIFDTIEEKVLIKEAFARWEKGRRDPSCCGINPDDCRIIHLVEYPAEYETIKALRLKEVAQCKEVILPAQYKTITRQVVKKPAVYAPVKENAPFSVLPSFSLFPNPATSFIKVHFSPQNPSLMGKIEILSLEGKLCQSIDFEGIETEISIENLREGMYILQISVNGETQRLRFAKVGSL
jgi:hypothetical protein